MTGHGGDVYKAAVGADEREERSSGEEGAVVVCLESLLYDIDVWKRYQCGLAV